MKRIKGQVLNEALIAMGIVTVGILGMVGFLSKAISEGRYIADQTTAVNLAAEGVEIAKNILDGNAVAGGVAWNNGLETEGFYEVDYTSQSLGGVVSASENENVLRFLRKAQAGNAEFYKYNEGGETGFKRSVEIDYIASHQIRATSRVYWRARGGLLRNISLSSDFYYWR
jgi:Tfp pilus assembly protein PilV